MSGLTHSTSAEWGNTAGAGTATPLSPVQGALNELARTQDVTLHHVELLEKRLADVLRPEPLRKDANVNPSQGVRLLDALEGQRLSASAISERLQSILERVVL